MNSEVPFIETSDQAFTIPGSLTRRQLVSTTLFIIILSLRSTVTCFIKKVTETPMHYYSFFLQAVNVRQHSEKSA